MHAMKAHEEMESELHLFLTSVLNEGQFSASRPLNRKLGGPQRQPDVLERRKNPNHTSLNENYVVPCICLRAI